MKNRRKVTNIFGHMQIYSYLCSRNLDLYCYETKLRAHIYAYYFLHFSTNGSYVITKDKCSFIDTPKVEVADTVGAGDSFTAAFIAKILSGATIEQAHEVAVQVSAYVCTQSGAMPCLPQEFIN